MSCKNIDQVTLISPLPNFNLKKISKPFIFRLPQRSITHTKQQKKQTAKLCTTQILIKRPQTAVLKKIKQRSMSQNFRKTYNIVQSVPQSQKLDTIQKFLSPIQNLQNYKIINHIGKGNFSIVSSAINILTKKKKAIKAYQKITQLDSHRIKLITNQIQSLKTLDHKNIIKLQDVIKDKNKNKLLLVMQNGGNQTLRGIIRKSYKLTENNAKIYVRQILQALLHCHQRKICHRDLKPQNILIDNTGNIKIIDFGFSTNTNNKLTTFCGTPPFMCPQITKRIPYYGQNADIWALGIISYLMIQGNLPFRANNEKQLYRLIQSCKYQIKSTISKNYKRFLSKALCLDVNKRATAQTLLKQPWIAIN